MSNPDHIFLIYHHAIGLRHNIQKFRIGFSPSSYQHGVDLVVDAVQSGRAKAAILIRPVSVTEIERTARERLLMPPKSTFFAPKLLTGLVIRTMT
jgi:uncharacterized protein (DUF1015 family)